MKHIEIEARMIVTHALLGNDQVSPETVDLLVQETAKLVKQEAIGFVRFVDNTVRAGATTTSLWNQYEEQETSLRQNT